MREALSVVIIACNEEKALPACLESVSFADEIVVVDSGSEDGTAAIARRYGARVIQQKWLGYGKQKQYAVDCATHDWVLCIDADERVSEALAGSLQQVMQAPGYTAYQMPRCNRFMGRFLRHGEGYPDMSLRLFHRAHARWSEDTVHEKVVADGETGRLYGDLLHESEEGLQEYLEKQNHYTTLQAEAMFARGKKVHSLKMLFSPVLRFIKFYFIRLGFLDGLPGLVHISIGCFNSFMKYAKLRELVRERGRQES